MVAEETDRLLSRKTSDIGLCRLMSGDIDDEDRVSRNPVRTSDQLNGSDYSYTRRSKTANETSCSSRRCGAARRVINE